jgi:hypothetical protein
MLKRAGRVAQGVDPEFKVQSPPPNKKTTKPSQPFMFYGFFFYIYCFLVSLKKKSVSDITINTG